MVDGLKNLVLGSIRYFRNKNSNRLPQNIIVFRDGVSEGQYQKVLDVELASIRDAIKEIYPASDQKKRIPKISIVVVGKRHHTRFYATNENDADPKGNPQNGTVVDRGVTEGRNWDFYMQAHYALQGTARPAHYYVIYDEVFRSAAPSMPDRNAADALEQLSHKLCYSFGRATKAVSIVPPAYYADLVCERARRYLAHLFAPTAPSSAASSSSVGQRGPGAAGQQGLVKIHDRIKDAMFFI